MPSIWCERWLSKRDGLSFPVSIPSSPAQRSCFTTCVFFFLLQANHCISNSDELFYILILIVKLCKWVNTYLLFWGQVWSTSVRVCQDDTLSAYWHLVQTLLAKTYLYHQEMQIQQEFYWYLYFITRMSLTRILYQRPLLLQALDRIPVFCCNSQRIHHQKKMHFIPYSVFSQEKKPSRFFCCTEIFYFFPLLTRNLPKMQVQGADVS